MRSSFLINSSFRQSILGLAVSVFVSTTQAGVLEVLQRMTGETTSPTSALQQSTQLAPDVIEKNIIAPIVKELSYGEETNIKLQLGFQIIKKENVPTSNHTDFQIVYKENFPVAEFYYDEVALKNPEKIVLDLAFLSLLTGRGKSNLVYSVSAGDSHYITIANQFESPHILAEVLTDAQAGSLSAAVRLLKVQIAALRSIAIAPSAASMVNIKNELPELLKAKEQELTALEAKAKAFARDQQKKLNKWKADFKVQEKYEAMDQKLNDLILNNDRKGVARMIEAYLPWPLMEPVEYQAWKTWIEAIENPDRKNTTIAFRGVDYETDKIQRKQTPQGEVFGFMSTVLTKNQGSYTRRLRSLTTNRQRSGAGSLDQKVSNIPTLKITNQMKGHAENPIASNFLSFTANPGIANEFSGVDKNALDKPSMPRGGILVVEIDSRRLFPNIEGMPSEAELLVPLIVFPDEIVKYHEGRFDEKFTIYDFFKEISAKKNLNYAQYEQQLDKPYEPTVLDETYIKKGMNFLRTISEQALRRSASKGTVMCSKVF